MQKPGRRGKAAEDEWDSLMGTARTTSKYAVHSIGWAIGQYRQSGEWTKLRASSRRAYTMAFDRLHDLGKADITGLRRRHVLRLRDDLADTPAMANLVIAVLSAVCRWAIDREIIDTNPAANVERLAVGEWRRWTDEELQAFYAAAPEHLRRVMVLGLYTGQRRGDLCAMRWSDIFNGGVKVVQQKTGNKVRIPLHPELAAHLEQWRAGAVTLTVLANSHGRPWKPNALTAAYGKQCAALGLAGATIHGLRKTAAAKLAEAGCSAKQIMAITGHASLEEVQRYTREADQDILAGDAIRAFPVIKLSGL